MYDPICAGQTDAALSSPRCVVNNDAVTDLQKQTLHLYSSNTPSTPMQISEKHGVSVHAITQRTTRLHQNGLLTKVAPPLQIEAGSAVHLQSIITTGKRRLK